jgi:hypothetical protein
MAMEARYIDKRAVTDPLLDAQAKIMRLVQHVSGEVAEIQADIRRATGNAEAFEKHLRGSGRVPASLLRRNDETVTR